MIVINKYKDEIKGDLEQAQRAGVIVGTSAGLADLLKLTNIIPDPDELHERAERQAAQEPCRQPWLFEDLN